MLWNMLCFCTDVVLYRVGVSWHGVPQGLEVLDHAGHWTGEHHKALAKQGDFIKEGHHGGPRLVDAHHHGVALCR